MLYDTVCVEQCLFLTTPIAAGNPPAGCQNSKACAAFHGSKTNLHQHRPAAGRRQGCSGKSAGSGESHFRDAVQQSHPAHSHRPNLSDFVESATRIGAEIDPSRRAKRRAGPPRDRCPRLVNMSAVRRVIGLFENGALAVGREPRDKNRTQCLEKPLFWLSTLNPQLPRKCSQLETGDGPAGNRSPHGHRVHRLK